ncbi:hypothetical protein BGZ89_007850 [Linnemannia elongata]|nr:hypothetical protein BGZ89_007850 [Linnemannia elongata]
MPEKNRIGCDNCAKLFPRETRRKPLSGRVTRSGESKSRLLYLECRRGEFNANQESLLTAVDEYTDPINRAIILPLITHFEAREKYCVQHARLRSYRTNLALPVQASLTFGRTHLYKEQNIVVLARRMYGADVDIANARKVFVQPGDKVRQVPLGPIRERRNFIRQAFWEFGIFVTLEQSLVHRFVEYSERDLRQLVSRFCC